MAEVLTFDELKSAGYGVTAPEPVAGRYTLAFQHFGARALWSRRQIGQTTIAQALGVAEGLRREGDVAAWRLAAEIEAACRAAL